jgi:hypothetical protein
VSGRTLGQGRPLLAWNADVPDTIPSGRCGTGAYTVPAVVALTASSFDRLGRFGPPREIRVTSHAVPARRERGS